MQKKLALTIIIAVLITILTISPLTKADTAATSYSFANYSTLLTIPRAQPTDQSYMSAVGETFTLATDKYATSVTFYIQHTGAETNSILYGAIYATAADLPTGAALATSTNSINAISTRPVTPQPITFTFPSTLLTAGVTYAVVVYNTVYSGAFNQGYEIASDNSAPDYTGNAVDYASSAWATVAGQDLCFTLNVDSTSPTPTPAPGNDLWAGTWIENVIGIILPLAMILVPAFLGWKFAKAWGFFAGLNVGVILCYVYGQMIPLWGVVVMLVVDGLMLFGKLGMHD